MFFICYEVSVFLLTHGSKARFPNTLNASKTKFQPIHVAFFSLQIYRT